jgi:hypothetical protein
MWYKLKTLYSTEQAFNGDVITSDDEKYMGRLYILTTSDNKLLNLEIKEEWFLAYAGADFLISGHINNEEKWSLSAYKSLEPSFVYTNQTNIFDQIFSQEYMQEISYLREEEFLTISQCTNQSDDFSSNEDDESDVSKPKILTQMYIQPENIDTLRHLILRSSLDELLSLEQQQGEAIEMEVNQAYSENQSTFDNPNTDLKVIMNYFQRESAPRLDEDELFHAQVNLIERIMDEYQKQNISEFALIPFGNITIYESDNYFVLRDSEDEHTIFIATFEAEIIQGLSDVDALKIEMILNQLEIEDYRRERDISQQEREVSLVNENAHNLSQKQGIEYGA